MLTWSPAFLITVTILVLLYALFSIYLRKMTGLFIAAAFHIVLGLFSLPSIGLYVIVLAVIECIVGVVLIAKQK